MSQQDTENADRSLEDLSFEKALADLEKAVQSLETGGLTLEESTRLFERGIKLARVCSERLAAAELKISQIQTAYGKQMRFMSEGEPTSEDELAEG